jgi:hypothetical protein
LALLRLMAVNVVEPKSGRYDIQSTGFEQSLGLLGGSTIHSAVNKGAEYCNCIVNVQWSLFTIPSTQGCAGLFGVHGAAH